MLLRLPVEVRLQIYTWLFKSTRITFGRFFGIFITKTIPIRNSLAILRACRLIHKETAVLWLSQVFFNFLTAENLLDKFSHLPATTLSKIRHLRVGGRPTLIMPIGEPLKACHKLVWLLKLLPGLCLDRLTVLGAATGEVAYDTLEGLIKYGNGWKELYFITPNSKMLSFTKSRSNWDVFAASTSQSKPQPETWNDLLLQRDGIDSGASVTIYRSTQYGMSGAAINSRTRQLLQSVSSPAGLEEQLSGSKIVGKELLVVVKRGRQANLAEQTSPPYQSELDIRHWAGGREWKEIQYKCIEPPEIDIYLDEYQTIDEYKWEPVLSYT